MLQKLGESYLCWKTNYNQITIFNSKTRKIITRISLGYYDEFSGYCTDSKNTKYIFFTSYASFKYYNILDRWIDYIHYRNPELKFKNFWETVAPQVSKKNKISSFFTIKKDTICLSLLKFLRYPDKVKLLYSRELDLYEFHGVINCRIFVDLERKNWFLLAGGIFGKLVTYNFIKRKVTVLDTLEGIPTKMASMADDNNNEVLDIQICEKNCVAFLSCYDIGVSFLRILPNFEYSKEFCWKGEK